MPSFFHGNTSVQAEAAIGNGHDIVNGCNVLHARLGSSLEGAQRSAAIYTQREQTLMTRAAIRTQKTRDFLTSPPPPYSRVDELGPFASPPPPYDGYQGSPTPSAGFQPRTTIQQRPLLQRPGTLRRRPTRAVQRSRLPEHGTSQGNAEGESGTELNAAWKQQMREQRLALNALCAARQQEREAAVVPNNGADNANDLSGFNFKYQGYLERRGFFEH